VPAKVPNKTFWRNGCQFWNGFRSHCAQSRNSVMATMIWRKKCQVNKFFVSECQKAGNSGKWLLLPD
jgi:hypothetical protein